MQNIINDDREDGEVVALALEIKTWVAERLRVTKLLDYRVKVLMEQPAGLLETVQAE